MANLEVTYGAMNSGKSLKVLTTAFSYEERGLKTLLTKPTTDEKGGDYVVSRTGLNRKIDLFLPPETDIRELIKRELGTRGLNSVGSVLVDEAQFLEEEQADQLYQLAKLDDIAVSAFMLRTNFRGETFKAASVLLGRADVLTESTGYCFCGQKSQMNTREIDGITTFEGDEFVIDNQSHVAYETYCGTHWLEERAKWLEERAKALAT